MPHRARLLAGTVLSLFLSGCAHWPGPEHRAVTLDGIQQLLQQQAAQQPQPLAVPVSSPTECAGLAGVEDQLEAQHLQISHLSKQVQNLTAATPAFVNSSCPPDTPAAYYEGKLVVGSTEWIYLTPPGHHYQARVDSGATTSSLSAQDITRFERNGKRWVSFKLQHDDEAEPLQIEAPLVRNVRIRQASADEVERRPVVQLTINLGSGLQQDAEFTLTDRSQMTYPILLGREFLRDIVLIDVGRKNVQPKFQPDDGKLPVPAVPKAQRPVVVNPEAAEEPRVKPKAASKAEPKTEPKAEPKADPKSAPRAAPKTEPKAAPAAAEPEAEAQPAIPPSSAVSE